MIETRKQDRPVWKGDMTVSLFIGIVLGLWFTTYGAIHYFIQRPPAMPVVHVVFAMLITWICIWNIFHPPHHGSKYRRAHILLGRFALMTTLIMVILGAVRVWDGTFNFGFAIGISIGGALQIIFGVLGFYFIRFAKRSKQSINQHKIWMLLYFFAGCLIPAIMRLPNFFGEPTTGSSSNYVWIFPLLLGGTHLLETYYGKNYAPWLYGKSA